MYSLFNRYNGVFFFNQVGVEKAEENTYGIEFNGKYLLNRQMVTKILQ